MHPWREAIREKHGLSLKPQLDPAGNVAGGCQLSALHSLHLHGTYGLEGSFDWHASTTALNCEDKNMILIREIEFSN